MIYLSLKNEEKFTLKSLIGKRLIKIRHDPLDKFGQEVVYGRLELFFDNSIIMVEYDYAPFPLFGSKDDEHPVFSIKCITEDEAVSALENVEQINIQCDKVISEITLVEDYVEIEWDGKKDSSKILKAIIIRFENDEIAIQGDYMMPLLEIIKGESVTNKLAEPGAELKNDPETKYKTERFFVRVE